MRSLLRIAAVSACLTAALSVSAQTPQNELTEEQVLAHFKHEPSVQEVQDAAIRYYQVHPERIKSLRTNAQLKALVPILYTGFANSIGSQKRQLTDGLYTGLATGWKENEQYNLDAMALTVGATWNLDRLVFNAEVLDVQSLIGILDGVVREVTTIYYIRRRLQIDDLLRPPTDVASKISNKIRIEELTGLLDAMTGAFMSKSLKKARQAAARPAERRVATPTQLPPAPAPTPAAPATVGLPAKSGTLLAPR